jgi:hypothetical protein
MTSFLRLEHQCFRFIVIVDSLLVVDIPCITTILSLRFRLGSVQKFLSRLLGRHNEINYTVCFCFLAFASAARRSNHSQHDLMYDVSSIYILHIYNIDMYPVENCGPE